MIDSFIIIYYVIPFLTILEGTSIFLEVLRVYLYKWEIELSKTVSVFFYFVFKPFE